MIDNLVPECDVGSWEELDEMTKFKMEARASSDPVYFWNEPRMGNIKLWPSQEDILNEFYGCDLEGKRKYNELLFDAGRRGGKTTVAAIILLTELSRLLMMKNPQRHYNMLQGDPITLFTSSASVDQTLRTIFPRLRALLQNSPWFMQFVGLIRPVSKKISFPKNIVIEAVGSNLKTAQGRTIKGYVAEEINSVGSDDGKITPQELYDKISKGTVSFAPYNEDIRVAISSQTNEYDFLSQRIQRTIDHEIPGTLVKKCDTLELNPNLTKETLKNEKLRNEDSYNLEFGLGDVTRGDRYFKKNTLDRINWTEENLFDVPEIVSVTRQEEFVPTFHPSDFKYDSEAMYYYVSADPAVVGDPFGLAVMHITINGEVKVDGATVFRSRKKEAISSNAVERFIMKVINTIPVEKYIFDIYMYSDIREKIAARGIEVIQNHTRLDNWEQFKDQIGAGGVHIPYSEYFEKEMKELICKNGKVDHQPNGTNDMAEAICNGVTYPYMGETKYETPNIIAGTRMRNR